MGLLVSFPLIGIAHFVPTKVKFFGVIFWPYNKSFINLACSVKMTGYWPCSVYCICLTSTLSQLIKMQKKKKKNLANIQHLYPTLG